jgi:hypothetical protein
MDVYLLINTLLRGLLFSSTKFYVRGTGGYYAYKRGKSYHY